KSSDKVLAEVKNGMARSRRGDGDRRDQFSTAHRWPGWRDEGGEVPADPPHTNPLVVVITWCRPTGQFKASIVRLAVIDIIGQDGPPRCMPGFIGDDALCRAIQVVDFELGQQRQPVTVDITPPITETKSTTIPTVTQDGTDGVLAFAQQARHIERLVAQPVVVAGPSWVK